ncbi:mRNA capping enzyme [Amanita muscaria]
MSSIPELPGVPVPRQSEQEQWLKAHVAHLCHLDHQRSFPGAQPVSFTTKHLEKLENQDFWVCEKSDGIRVLFLIATDSASGDQSVYIIDRHNSYREVHGMFFPHHEDPRRPLGNTIVDGELVLDVDPQTKKETLRFLAFDCLVVDGQNVMPRPLDKRYGRLKCWFYKPYAKMIEDHPHVATGHPLQIKVKEITFSYHIDKVFTVDIPALQHGTDGLIYTCVSTPYSPGTDQNILKWKPPIENSIDFKLVLRFPPSKEDPEKPDFYAKPLFLLHVWCGDERGKPNYEEYDTMYVDDEEWEKMKLTGEQIDDRIVEVHWDPEVSGWRMMRFRDDKPTGNHKTTVQSIISSIADGVEKEALLARSNAIRNAWKARQGQQPQAQQAPTRPHAPPPPIPPQIPPSAQPMRRAQQGSYPPVDYHYGPLASSPWSKVSGPAVIAGVKR